MGNLGTYQTMTSLAKKVGGPKVLAVGTALAGWLVLRGSEAGVKGAFKAAKSAFAKRNATVPAKGRVLDVTSDGDDGNGLVLHAGDRYKVLESDGDAILVEVLGGENNPFFTSAEFLASVSDFPVEPPARGR